ncbi:MAG: MFS transporter [Armatimonadota bacterium]|nr:MFS transporter [bacterium]
MPQLLDRLHALKRDLKLLWTAVFCMMYGFGIYSAIFYNFATETLSIQPNQLGPVEAVREFPGILCFLLAALTMRVAEPMLGSIMLFAMSGGMAAYAWVHGIPSLMAFSFVWSVGFHAWMPLQSSLVLRFSGEGNNKGKRLGQTMCVGSLGSVLGMLTVRLIGNTIIYPHWFLFGSGMIFLAAVVMLGLRREINHADRPRFVWKRKYGLYYWLTLLEGGRKQVFMTFAVYALTREYHTSLKTVALLMVINNIVNMVGGPYVGRLIDRIGERKILMSSYSALILVFIGYAKIPNAHILYVLYCLDNFFYLSTTCLTTYLQKIAEPEDLTPALSTGVTANHVMAVVVPLIGGQLWASLGYQVTFLGGAVVVVVSLFLASRLRTNKKVLDTV